MGKKKIETVKVEKVKIHKDEKVKIEAKKAAVETITLALGNLRWNRLNVERDFNANEQRILAALELERSKLMDVFNKLKFKYGIPESENYFYEKGHLVKVKPQP